MKTENLIYTAKKLNSMHLGFLSKVIMLSTRICFSCDIPVDVKIGTGFRLAHHGLGVVIHPEAIIGDNVKIYQNVTIGKRDGNNSGGGVPILCNNIRVGVGAVILGNVVIGDNCRIGANAVVLCDVPANHTAVGVPARIIPHNE